MTIVTATATDTGLPAESCDAIYMAFNRQNIEGVMDCFHENPVLVDAKGRRIEGRGEVRRCYEASFASFPDGRCQLRVCTGNDVALWRSRGF